MSCSGCRCSGIDACRSASALINGVQRLYGKAHRADVRLAEGEPLHRDARRRAREKFCCNGLNGLFHGVFTAVSSEPGGRMIKYLKACQGNRWHNVVMR